MCGTLGLGKRYRTSALSMAPGPGSATESYEHIAGRPRSAVCLNNALCGGMVTLAGAMDEVQIYGKALTAEEVSQLCNPP